MKAKCYFISLVALATAGVCSAGERVKQGQLPAAVQRAVTSSAVATGPVKEITKDIVDGKVVYDVEFEKDDAINPRLRFAEDGTVVDNARFAARDRNWSSVDTESMLKLEDLPAAVRRTVEQEAAGREIADLDLEMHDNRKVYEVEFRESGVNQQIHVAEDGTKLAANDNERRAKSWFAGTQLEDTPTAVQETIRREAGDRRIADIDKERRTGRIMYEVEIEGENGQFQLHIAEDGSIVKDDRTERVAE
jgi:uncharacterized membrane protein YkoI